MATKLQSIEMLHRGDLIALSAQTCQPIPDAATLAVIEAGPGVQWRTVEWVIVDGRDGAYELTYEVTADGLILHHLTGLDTVVTREAVIL
jgi:hypothetical protein